LTAWCVTEVLAHSPTKHKATNERKNTCPAISYPNTQGHPRTTQRRCTRSRRHTATSNSRCPASTTTTNSTSSSTSNITRTCNNSNNNISTATPIRRTRNSFSSPHRTPPTATPMTSTSRSTRAHRRFHLGTAPPTSSRRQICHRSIRALRTTANRHPL
jgi:hypothetical protein